MTDERRRNDIGTNTSDVEVEPSGDGLRTSMAEADMHTSIPIVDMLLPSGHKDHVRIPHVNLSIMGYHPETLRTLVGTRSPSVRAPEVSTIPQLDGPRSLPRHELERGRINKISSITEFGSSQRDAYV